MNTEDLRYSKFSSILNKHYSERAQEFPNQFLKWFLEHILRLDEFSTDDACVDAKHDKGVDAIYVDDFQRLFS